MDNEQKCLKKHLKFINSLFKDIKNIDEESDDENEAWTQLSPEILNEINKEQRIADLIFNLQNKCIYKQ